MGTFLVPLSAYAEESSLTRVSNSAQFEHPFGENRDSWFGLFFQDKRVGHLHHQLLAPEPNAKHFRALMKKQIQIEGGTTVAISEKLLFSPQTPHILVEGSFKITRNGHSSSVLYRREKSSSSVTKNLNGTERTVRSEHIDYTLNDFLRVESCVSTQSLPCSSVPLLSLELKNLTLHQKQLVVSPLSEEKVEFAQEAAYEAKLYGENGSEESTHYLDRSGRPLLVHLGGEFRAVREEKALALRTQNLPDPKELASVRIDQTLEQPDRIKRLVLEVDGPLPRLVQTSVRQRVIDSGKANSFHLETTLETDSEKVENKEQINEYLVETLDYPVQDPTILALSRKIVRGAYSDSGKVVRLLRFVSQHLNKSDSAHLSVLHSLEQRSGNCRDHARLFTTLARAAGIPTREVAGLVYDNEERQSFAPHSWNEVLVAGRWLSIDPTFNKQQLNPTYISFGVGADGLQNLIHAIGKISLKVLQISYHEV